MIFLFFFGLILNLNNFEYYYWGLYIFVEHKSYAYVAPVKQEIFSDFIDVEWGRDGHWVGLKADGTLWE